MRFHFFHGPHIPNDCNDILVISKRCDLSLIASVFHVCVFTPRVSAKDDGEQYDDDGDEDAAPNMDLDDINFVEVMCLL